MNSGFVPSDMDLHRAFFGPMQKDACSETANQYLEAYPIPNEKYGSCFYWDPEQTSNNVEGYLPGILPHGIVDQRQRAGGRRLCMSGPAGRLR